MWWALGQPTSLSVWVCRGVWECVGALWVAQYTLDPGGVQLPNDPHSPVSQPEHPDGADLCPPQMPNSQVLSWPQWVQAQAL